MSELKRRLMRFFSVGCTVKKLIIACVGGIVLLVSSASNAALNPFKKSKNYTFGSNIAWYEHNDAALKTGAVRADSDTHYYHLNIDNDRLFLRLGKNDPSGEIENTRLLERLSIVEINVDGNRLPLFDWCLVNQQTPSSKLKQDAIVANGVCVNAGGGGDFVMNLNQATRNILRKASVLEFIVEPYGRSVKLTYSMLGYSTIMKKINKPVVVKSVAKPKPVVVAAPKPKLKPKAKPKVKPVKICYANPPTAFKSQISAVSYPCGDKAKKTSAESKVSSQVRQEETKQEAADNEAREIRQRAREDNKREIEWGSKQSVLWISRCEKHWSKNRSPCFCEKYFAQAPTGTKNTCNK